ncbi:Com family DNA-binding transcriptional regulator [Desulfurispirillum indicum]|uniref:Com family DNA-binding transcriptional regulator n=1 Tax=Desulfurispirillum indicum TaxID=936456 RepID=UPI001CF9A2FD|nr:Com family DNA-binding transcriptional regulator [Desulfurispirillum indicum]
MSKAAPADVVPSCCREGQALHEVRCKRCNRLLFKGSVISVEVKCPKCRSVQHFDYSINAADSK